MSRKRIWKSLAGLSLVCVLALGCGDDGDDNSGGGDAGAGGGGGNVAAGMAAVNNRVCGTCHTGTTGLLAGNPALMAPNLTPDGTTGLGGWSAAQIATAILTGVDNEGKALCASMQKYGTAGMQQTEANDIAAYLKSIPAIAGAVPDSCN